jgi:hypothetical protein
MDHAMNTDFLDDDVVNSVGVEDQPEEVGEEVPVRPITETGLGRMAKKQEERSKQMAETAEELEVLRMRQGDLEREKQDLLELTHKQQDYEKSKREVVENLARGLVVLEKEELQATRRAELLAVLRQRFLDALSELQAIREGDWNDDSFETELNKALVVVEDARKLYRKGVARMEAEALQEQRAGTPAAANAPDGQAVTAAGGGFGFWLKVGLAVSLPLGIIVVLLFLLAMVMTGMI